VAEDMIKYPLPRDGRVTVTVDGKSKTTELNTLDSLERRCLRELLWPSPANQTSHSDDEESDEPHYMIAVKIEDPDQEKPLMNVEVPYRPELNLQKLFPDETKNIHLV
jgi:hypothetical protein